MVEVMVAMALGAMVVLGVIQVFTANRQTFRMQDAMAMTQESGTFAIDYIARDLQRSGFGGAASSENDDYGFEWANTVDGGPGGNDRLAIVYDPTITNQRYCTGEDTGAATIISNRYWVNDDGELLCQGAVFNGAAFVPAGQAQVIVDNVESFQVLFGVDTHHIDVADTNGDGIPDQDCPLGVGEPTVYVPATLVPNVIARGKLDCPTASTTAGAQNASTIVRTVRIALLLSTENDSGAVVDPERVYSVLDEEIGAPLIEPGDGRLRRLFTKTVVMRNAEEVARL